MLLRYRSSLCSTEMKFLVYGAEGWIGSAVVETLERCGDVVVKGRRVITMKDVLSDLLSAVPDFVISSLGRIGTPSSPTADYLEQKGKLLENITCNLTAPILIAQATGMGKPIPMLYIGTGCIFEYDKEHPLGTPGYKEEDVPNFFGASYSVVKAQTDQLLQHFPHVICARLRLPISTEDNSRDLISKLIRYKKILSIPNSITILPDIIPVLIASLVSGRHGIINAVNPGVISHAQIVQLHQSLTGKETEYELITETELKSLLLAGRSNTALSTALIEQWLSEIPLPLKRKYGAPDKILDVQERVHQIIAARQIAFKERSANRVLLVTGGCGFIGSNFINYWMKTHPDDTVVNLDSLERSSNIKNIEDPLHKNYHFVRGNLLDTVLLNGLFETHKFSHVIHFAAAGNVDQSFANPMECTTSNVLGTHALLDTIRKQPVLRLFLYISTDEVYGEIPEGANEESTTFFPTNPYAATKAAAECLVLSYGKSYHIPYIISRANNVYGQYQYPAQVIPKFTTQLLQKRKMPVHGTGSAVRKFVHVSDKCRALDVIVQKGTIGQIYNIGTEFEISVKQICQLLLSKILGPTEQVEDWIMYVPDRPYNDCRYSVNCNKLRRLGWKPTVVFEDGLTHLVQWYKANQDHWAKNGG